MYQCAVYDRTSYLFHFFLFSRRKLGESNLRYESLERNARRFTNKFPKIPKSPKEIIDTFNDSNIYNEYAYNLRKTSSFYKGTEIHLCGSFSVFASDQMINMIEENIEPKDRFYLLDGTFRVAPTSFYQLLLIHIEFKNDVSSYFRMIDLH